MKITTTRGKFYREIIDYSIIVYYNEGNVKFEGEFIEI